MLVEGESKIAAQIREKYEAQYDDLITHYRRWANPKFNDPHYRSEVSDQEWFEFNQSGHIVTNVLETDLRKHRLLKILALPLSYRLAMAEQWDFKYPQHPNTQKQIVRSLKGIEKDLGDICTDLELTSLQETAEGRKLPKDPDNKLANFSRMLHLRAHQLLSWLPPQKREAYQKTSVLFQE